MAGTTKRKTAGASGTPAKRGRKAASASVSSSSTTAKSPEKPSSTGTSSLPNTPPKSSSSSGPPIDPQEELLSSSTSLFEYLEHLPHHTLRKIYDLPAPRGPIVASAVLRSSSLTDIARQCVLRLVACGGSFLVKNIVEGWIGRAGRKEAFFALKRMESMGIIESLGLCRNLLDMGKESSLLDDDGEDADESERRNKLLQKDAVLTPEFKNAMTVYLATSASTPWPVITQEQIEEYKKNGGGGDNHHADQHEKEKPSRDPPTRQELESYTQRAWDSVLHFLVGSDDNTTDHRKQSSKNNNNNNSNNHHHDRGIIEEPPEAMVHFLTRIGLMQEDPDYTGKDKSLAPLVITSKGYEFMLRDVNAQVWQFVLQYLNAMSHHEQKDLIRMEALSFLICLGSCRVGEGFHSSILGSKSARVLMRDFARFGLLFVCRIAGKTAFYPTAVAVNLVASNEKAGRQSNDKGVSGQSNSAAAIKALEEALANPIPSRNHLAVIVQTNFQVCAYTKSKLHLSTLGLFCDVSSFRRLPNVIFFHLTRDSVRSAFRLGVTADQILRFLAINAHPMLRKENLPLVPPNVSDQILLWDRERTRVVMDEVCVHQCRDAAEFAAVGQYASDADALAWGAAHTNKLYIHFQKAEQVYGYIRRWRTKNLGR